MVQSDPFADLGGIREWSIMATKGACPHVSSCCCPNGLIANFMGLRRVGDSTVLAGVIFCLSY